MQVRLVRFVLLPVAWALTASSCASTGPARAPSPVAKGGDSTAAAEAARWSPRYAPGSWRYTLRSDATVTLATDTTATGVPVHNVTHYTIALDSAGTELRLTGSVDSATVLTEGRIPQPQGQNAAGTRFSAQLAPEGRLSGLTSTPAAACPSGTDPTVAAVQTLFTTLPPELTIGSQWRDTVSVVTCRGDVPITTTTVRDYQVRTVTTWRGQPALEVVRTGTIAIHGGKDAPADRGMSVTGSGTSSMTMEVEPRTGMLLEASGESHSTFTVGTSRSSFLFKQDATETAVLESPILPSSSIEQPERHDET